MKTYKNLYPQVWAWDNLYRAYGRARRGKRLRPAAADFEWDREGNLVRLQDELRDQTYQPGPYSSFYIHEPKRRLISAAPFRDRVVHHALCQVIEPFWERRFIDTCYANRVGKGTHKALDCAQAFARRYRYVLPCDVRQFFPSIDHAILRGILGHLFADAALLGLIDRILQSGVGVLSGEYEMVYFPQDDPSTGSGQGLFAACRPRGLPIGNLTSQFWANVYLNGLDHLIKRTLECPAYLRYFVLTKRLQDAALDFQERIVEAALSQGAQRAERLNTADITLSKVRFYLRLTHELTWLDSSQYAHASRMVAEIGNLLGGWLNPKPKGAPQSVSR